MTEEEEYSVGKLVWAKVPGFSFWPAKIEAEEDLPQHVVEQKPSSTTTAKPVYFFGSYEFGWIPPSNLRDFESHFDALHKKSKSKPFLKGLEEIRDPSTWPVKGQFDSYSEQVSMGGVDLTETLDQNQSSSKRRKSGGTGEGGEKKKRKKTEDGGSSKKKTEKPAKPELTAKEKLMRLRMKLQIFLQQKEPYQTVDFEKANGYLTDTEKIEMDVNLFRETKIGKVIKHLSKKGINEFEISTRCKKLTEKWITELHDSLASATSAGTPGTATLDTPADLQAPPKSPLKESAKSPVKEVAKSPVKESSKSPVKEASKSPVKEVSKSPVKEASKSPVKEVSKSPIKEDVAKSPVEEAAKSPVKEIAKSPAKEAPKSPMKEVSKSSIKEPISVKSPKPEDTLVPGSPKAVNLGSPKSPVKA